MSDLREEIENLLNSPDIWHVVTNHYGDATIDEPILKTEYLRDQILKLIEAEGYVKLELVDGYSNFVGDGETLSPEAMILWEKLETEALREVVNKTIDEKTGEQILSKRTISLMRRNYHFACKIKALSKLAQLEADQKVLNQVVVIKNIQMAEKGKEIASLKAEKKQMIEELESKFNKSWDSILMNGEHWQAFKSKYLKE